MNIQNDSKNIINLNPCFVDDSFSENCSFYDYITEKNELNVATLVFQKKFPTLNIFDEIDSINSDPSSFHLLFIQATSLEKIPIPLVAAWITLAGRIFYNDTLFSYYNTSLLRIPFPINCLVPANLLDALEKIEMSNNHPPILFEIFNAIAQKRNPNEINLDLFELERVDKWIDKHLTYNTSPFLSYIALLLSLSTPLNSARVNLIFRKLLPILKGSFNFDDLIKSLQILQKRCLITMPDHGSILSKVLASNLKNFSELEWITFLAQSKNEELIQLSLELWVLSIREMTIPPSIPLMASPLNKKFANCGLLLFKVLCKKNLYQALALMNILFKRGSLTDKIQFNCFVQFCFHLTKTNFIFTSSDLNTLIQLGSWVFSLPISIKMDLKQKRVFRIGMNIFINQLYSHNYYHYVGDSFLIRFNQLGFEIYGEEESSNIKKWFNRLTQLLELGNKTANSHALFIFKVLFQHNYITNQQLREENWQFLLTQLCKNFRDLDNNKENPVTYSISNNIVDEVTWLDDLIQIQDEISIEKGEVKEDFLDDSKAIFFLLAENHMYGKARPIFLELLLKAIEPICCALPIDQENLNRLKSLLNFLSVQKFYDLCHLFEILINRINDEENSSLYEQFENFILTTAYNDFFFKKELITPLVTFLDKWLDFSSCKIKNITHVFFLITKIEGLNLFQFPLISKLIAKILKRERFEQNLIHWLTQEQSCILNVLNENCYWEELSFLINFLNKKQKRNNNNLIFSWNICKNFIEKNNYEKLTEYIEDVFFIEIKNESILEIDSNNEFNVVNEFIKVVFQIYKRKDIRIGSILLKFIFEKLINKNNELNINLDQFVTISNELKNEKLLNFLNLIPLFILEKKKEHFKVLWINLIIENENESIKNFKFDYFHILTDKKFLTLFSMEELSCFSNAQSELLLNSMKNDNKNKNQLSFYLMIMISFNIKNAELWTLFWGHLKNLKDKTLIEEASIFFMKEVFKNGDLLPSSTIFPMLECLENSNNQKFCDYVEKFSLEKFISFESYEAALFIYARYFNLLLKKKENNLELLIQVYKKRIEILDALELLPNLQIINKPSIIHWVFEVDNLVARKYIQFIQPPNALLFIHSILRGYFELFSSEDLKNNHVIYLFNFWSNAYASLKTPDTHISTLALDLIKNNDLHNNFDEYFFKMIPNILVSFPNEDALTACILFFIKILKHPSNRLKDIKNIHNIFDGIILLCEKINYHYPFFNDCIFFIDKALEQLQFNEKKIYQYKCYYFLCSLRNKYENPNNKFPTNNLLFFKSNFQLIFVYLSIIIKKNDWLFSKEMQNNILDNVLELIKNRMSYEINLVQICSLIEHYTLYYSNIIHEFADYQYFIHHATTQSQLNFNNIDEKRCLLPISLRNMLTNDSDFKKNCYLAIYSLKFLPPELEEEIDGEIKNLTDKNIDFKLNILFSNILRNIENDNSPSRIEHSLKLLFKINKKVTIDRYTNPQFKKSFHSFYQSITSNIIKYYDYPSNYHENQLLIYDLHYIVYCSEFNELDDYEFFNLHQYLFPLLFDSTIKLLQSNLVSWQNESFHFSLYYAQISIKILNSYFNLLKLENRFKKNEYLRFLDKIEKILPIVLDLEINRKSLISNPRNLKIPKHYYLINKILEMLTRLPDFAIKLSKKKKILQKFLQEPLRLLYTILEKINLSNDLENSCEIFTRLILKDKQRQHSIFLYGNDKFNSLIKILIEKFSNTKNYWHKIVLEILKIELATEESILNQKIFNKIYKYFISLQIFFDDSSKIESGFQKLSVLIHTYFNEINIEARTKIQMLLIQYLELLFANHLVKMENSLFKIEVNRTINWYKKNSDNIPMVLKFLDLKFLLEKEQHFSEAEIIPKIKELMEITLNWMIKTQNFNLENRFAEILYLLPLPLRKHLSKEWLDLLQKNKEHFKSKEAFTMMIEIIMEIDLSFEEQEV